MIAVGDISILKPNSDSIPIDKNDGDLAIYLDKEFLFYIDIEDRGKLVYTVKPLTLKTEIDLITSLNEILKNDIYKICLIESDNITPKQLTKLYHHNLLTKNNIDDLLIMFSKCLNPEIFLPSLKGIFKAFTKDSLTNNDYKNLYEELIKIEYYKKPSWIEKYWHKSKYISILKNKPLDYILNIAYKVVDSYTKAILKHQELYLKYKVISNIIRYEREFKKKLLKLFLEKTMPTQTQTHLKTLDKSTLLYEKNVDSTKTGYSIPVF